MISTHAIEANLARLEPEQGVALDFTDVQAITGAIADELVATLTRRHGDRVDVVGANEDVAETIELAIGRRRADP